MDALALLADPTRRRIVELLADTDLSAGEIAAYFDIARPGVSRHLRQLREGGIISATKVGQRQIYRLEPDQLIEIDRWLAPFRSFWTNRLDALDTELARGRRSDTAPSTSRGAPETAAHGATPIRAAARPTAPHGDAPAASRQPSSHHTSPRKPAPRQPSPRQPSPHHEGARHG